MADPFSLALTVAVNLASMALTASQSHEGPRLQDLSVTVADYGTPIPYLMGRRRIECPVMHAEPLREEKTKNKTKGGKYTEYKYYGTWASLVCGNRVYSFNRIWGDRHLIYDVNQPRQFFGGGSGPKIKPGDNLRFYYGTEDQLPDERIAARIEHDEGDAALTPAYRGTAYVMFEDIPLENFGNRMPQVSIEVDSNDPTPIVTPESWGNYTRIAFGEPPPPESSWPGVADGENCTPGGTSGWFGIASEVPVSSEWAIGLGDCSSVTTWEAVHGTSPNFIVGHRHTHAGIFVWDWRSQVWQSNGTGSAVYIAEQTTQPTTTLGDICERIALEAGMAESDFDFSQLDQVIYGFSWVQGRAADIIMSLLEMHDSDIRPNGFIQEGIKRNQPLSGPTITYDWMARRRGEDGQSEPPYKIMALSESELPRRIMAVYSEIEAEQQPNTAVAQRNGPSVWTKREVPVDLTSLAETADTIQPLVERSLRRQWMDAVSAEMTLTPKHYGLIPGQTRNLGFENGVTIRGRLQRLTIKADRSLFCRWLRDGAVPVAETNWEDDEGSIVHNLPDSPGAIGSGRPPDDIYDPAPSVGWVLDLPLLSDADDRTAPFAYFAASPDAGLDDDGNEPDWSGATFLHSDSGDPESYENPWEIVGSGSRATHGTCGSILPPALSTVIDEGSELVVEILVGTLESVSLDELVNDGTLNLALVGDELIQFREAIVQSGGQYLLRGLIRGCRGTERFISGHTEGELFLLCNAMLGIHSQGASEIGDTDYYKVASNGFDPADADPFSLEYTGASHRPYSLVHVTIEANGNDWIIDGLRRSRIGGSSFNGQNIPLGETSELYRIKFLNDYGDVEATRETTSLPFIYTEAMQLEDWGSVQSEVTIDICQMSPALSLEGYSTTASSED